MIKKSENKNTTYMNFVFEKNKEDVSASNYVNEIIKIKKFPFSKVYLSLPMASLPIFFKVMKSKDVKYKNAGYKNNTAFIEF
jgi:hypothetical protein